MRTYLEKKGFNPELIQAFMDVFNELEEGESGLLALVVLADEVERATMKSHTLPIAPQRFGELIVEASKNTGTAIGNTAGTIVGASKDLAHRTQAAISAFKDDSSGSYCDPALGSTSDFKGADLNSADELVQDFLEQKKVDDIRHGVEEG